MFKNVYQGKYITALHAVGSKPLSIWNITDRNGKISVKNDEDMKSRIIDIEGDVFTTYIVCPKDKDISLGIKLPIITLKIKNMKKFMSFEIQILDDSNTKRRFRFSNFNVINRINVWSTSLPLNLNEGWNQVQLNLKELTKIVYGTNYIEACRIEINANCRVRTVYFTDRIYSEDELVPEYKLYQCYNNRHESK